MTTVDETPTPKTSGSFRVFYEAAVELRRSLVSRALTYYASDGPRADRLLRLAQRADLLAEGFATWPSNPPSDVERGRDIDTLFELRELAREGGVRV